MWTLVNLLARQLASNSTLQIAAGFPALDPDLALSCLNSVPLDRTGGLKQLEGLKTLINFQSDLSYLKDPPSGWLYPGVDVHASLNGMTEKLQNGGYNGEYSFQLEIFDLITSIYDFHAVYRPDILNVLPWFRNASLVSVSVDGSSLPQVSAILVMK